MGTGQSRNTNSGWRADGAIHGTWPGAWRRANRLLRGGMAWPGPDSAPGAVTAGLRPLPPLPQGSRVQLSWCLRLLDAGLSHRMLSSLERRPRPAPLSSVGKHPDGPPRRSQHPHCPPDCEAEHGKARTHRDTQTAAGPPRARPCCADRQTGSLGLSELVWTSRGRGRARAGRSWSSGVRVWPTPASTEVPPFTRPRGEVTQATDTQQRAAHGDTGATDHHHTSPGCLQCLAERLHAERPLSTENEAALTF